MVERKREELVILLNLIKDFGDREEKGRRNKRKEKKIKVWKLNQKPFLMMFGFGENPNFA